MRGKGLKKGGGKCPINRSQFPCTSVYLDKSHFLYFTCQPIPAYKISPPFSSLPPFLSPSYPSRVSLQSYSFPLPCFVNILKEKETSILLYYSDHARKGLLTVFFLAYSQQLFCLKYIFLWTSLKVSISQSKIDENFANYFFKNQS